MKHKRQLMILPFDHRSSFSKKLMGFGENLTDTQVKAVQRVKKVVYDGFKKTISKYKDKSDFGMLVDEQFGSSILKDASKKDFKACCPVEKSGQKEFQFEYGNQFGKHIEEVNPDNVKVLVRYNPANKELNKRQLKRLKRLSDYCMKTDRKLLFELLVPPSRAELKKFHGNKKTYDHKKRAQDTVKAIKEISKELYVDVWKLEGEDTLKAWKDIISAIRTGQNKDDFSIVVLGRGENKQKVIEWLKIAAKFPKVNGFAVGRTIFFKPLQEYKEMKINRDKAVDKISRNFSYFVNLWLKEKKIKLD